MRTLLIVLLGLLLSAEPLSAQVTLDNCTESHTGTTSSQNESSFSWTHTVAANARGIVVWVFRYGTFNAGISGVTVGATALTEDTNASAIDTAGEPMLVRTWFMGSGSIPTGSQSITVSRGNNADSMYAVACSVIASGDIEIAGIVKDEEDGTLAERNVDDGRTSGVSLRFAAVQSGENSASNVVGGPNSTSRQSFSPGNRVIRVLTETTGGFGSRPVGVVWNTSDDRAAVYFAIREVQTAQPPTHEAVSFAGAAITGADPLQVPQPSGTQAGDLLAAFVWAESPEALGIPSGFTFHVGENNPAGPLYSVGVFTKVATASEPSTYTFTTGAAQFTGVIMARISGVDTTTNDGVDVFATWTETTSDTTATPATVTTTGPAIVYYFGGSFDAPTHTFPAGTTEVWDQDGLPLGYETVNAAGTTTQRTITLSQAVANKAWITIAFKGTGGGGEPGTPKRRLLLFGVGQ